MKTIRILAILFAVTGCASASRPAFRDPASANHEFTKVAVFAVGMDQDNGLEIEHQVCVDLAPVQCVQGKKLLPPDRTFLPGEIDQSLTQANVDGVLLIALGDDQMTSAYLASIEPRSSSSSAMQSGAASLYGNIIAWNASSQTATVQRATAVPLFTYDRTARAVAGLIDRKSGKTAWAAELKTRGQGVASVSDKGFDRAATNELATQLKENHLIGAPATSPY